ncbi:Hsp70 protein-domain-containing protein [Multifurca ochricompacta]|uniref:Hsp70 protein-domain-containing protein n=1 Tax=Multifurca ochricompacta TaxID=376703 RepID=A0AAD4LXY6_9AGAM|nr:Hsp70 protein-domain-containing protein [Multifurca ochricompacta]
MSLNGQIPNGSAQAPIELTSSQTVIGINFGNSFASIAVLTKEGLAECIANEDGERQIACAISFHGEETYIGNEAKQQLIKNSANTIIGFRNLLGKRFSELPKDRPTSSAPVIQHPDSPDTPAYRVKVLQPAPSPLSPAASALTTKTNTPAASQVATPRSEPIPAERVLTPADVTTLFLRSLLQSAEAFLGKKVDGAVLTVPGWFVPAQLDALQEAAEAAGIRVLQLLEDPGAAAFCAASNTANVTGNSAIGPDRTQLVVDLGASSLALSLLAVRQGLFHHLTPPSHHTELGGDTIDDRLLKFFAKDFTKKTSVPLKVAPATEVLDLRAEARLRLALLHTKRTIAASVGGVGGSAATCAVESLKDGLDYTGTINRLRFDMEAAPIYSGVAARAGELLQRAGLDWIHVDEVIYTGGSACLPGLDAALAVHLREDAFTPFLTGTVSGGGVGDPTTILARGAALQARILAEISGADEQVRQGFGRGSELVDVKATARTIGVLFPEAATREGTEGLHGQWIGGIQTETPVPARRTYILEVDLGEGAEVGERHVGLEVWEVKEGIKIEKVKLPKEDEDDAQDEDEEEEEEEIEVKEKVIKKESYLGALSLVAKEGRKEGNRWRTSIEIRFLIDSNGKLESIFLIV